MFLDHEAHEVRATIMQVPRVGPRRHGARDLLREILRAPWVLGDDTPALPSAQARRRRAELLASALGLELRNIEGGHFLDGSARTHAEFHALLCRQAGEGAGSFPCDEAHAFAHLWRFRRAAAALARHNSGFLEASGEYHGLIRMTSIGARLDDLLEVVDEALCLLLDPERRTVEESALLGRGWISDTELHEMEMDEW